MQMVLPGAHVAGAVFFHLIQHFADHAGRVQRLVDEEGPDSRPRPLRGSQKVGVDNLPVRPRSSAALAQQRASKKNTGRRNRPSRCRAAVQAARLSRPRSAAGVAESYIQKPRLFRDHDFEIHASHLCQLIRLYNHTMQQLSPLKHLVNSIDSMDLCGTM